MGKTGKDLSQDIGRGIGQSLETLRIKALGRWLNRGALPPLAFYAQLGRVVYRKLGPPILALIGPFYTAYAVWLLFGRKRPIEPDAEFRRLYQALIAMQAFHLIEEWNTGFHRLFPAWWGSFFFGDPDRYPPWPEKEFVTGNVLMDGLWVLAAILLPKKNAWANYTVYSFLAGMLVNAFGHPLYALHLARSPALKRKVEASGYGYTAYFPGLFTSFGHLVLSLLMVRLLRRQHEAARSR